MKYTRLNMSFWQRSIRSVCAAVLLLPLLSPTLCPVYSAAQKCVHVYDSTTGFLVAEGGADSTEFLDALVISNEDYVVRSATPSIASPVMPYAYSSARVSFSCVYTMSVLPYRFSTHDTYVGVSAIHIFHPQAPKGWWYGRGS